MEDFILGVGFALVFHGVPLLVLSGALGAATCVFARQAGVQPGLAVVLNALPLIAAFAYITSGGGIPAVPAHILLGIFSEPAASGWFWSFFGLLWGVGYGYVGRFKRLIQVGAIVSLLFGAGCATTGMDFEHFSPTGFSRDDWVSFSVQAGLLYLVVGGLSMVDVYRMARRKQEDGE